MIDFVVKKWEKNKEKLENYFLKTAQADFAYDYHCLVRRVIDIILNDDDYSYDKGCQHYKFETNDISVIDYGGYQGTRIFIFHYDTYQPSPRDTFYTSVYYGSCSGCDTLLRINKYSTDKKPTEEQVKDYMILSLHLIQNINTFKEN
jgi:hypothetical protein